VSKSKSSIGVSSRVRYFIIANCLLVTSHFDFIPLSLMLPSIKGNLIWVFIISWRVASAEWSFVHVLSEIKLWNCWSQSYKQNTALILNIMNWDDGLMRSCSVSASCGDLLDNTLIIHPNPNPIKMIIGLDDGSYKHNVCLNAWVIMVDGGLGCLSRISYCFRPRLLLWHYCL
jgi:hypothetical protein